MKLERLLVATGVFAGAAYLLTFTASCDEEQAAADGVVYLGGATDEALDALVAATAKSDDSKAITFEAPAKDEVIPGDDPFTFVWLEAGAQARIDPLQPRPKHREAPVLERALGVLLAGTPVAHAHGDPISGPAYYLIFSSSTEKELVKVFTTGTDYQPGGNEWNKLKGVDGTVTLRLVWADFEENRIVQDGGPWSTPPLTFTIQ
jgi:hypothetical protein